MTGAPRDYFAVMAQVLPVLFLALLIERRALEPSGRKARDISLLCVAIALVFAEIGCLAVLAAKEGTGDVVTTLMTYFLAWVLVLMLVWPLARACLRTAAQSRKGRAAVLLSCVYAVVLAVAALANLFG